MLMLLLSSMIGTIAAEKPANPGKPDNKGPKPPPIPPTFEFTISIGLPVDDFFLVSGVEMPGEDPYLEAEAYADTCGWYIPPTNPRARSGGWDAHLPRSWPPEPDECGVYAVNLDGMDPMTIEAQSFHIGRFWLSQKVREFNRQPVDFWELHILWGVKLTTDGVADYDDAWRLRVWTDWDFDPDGTYYPEPIDKWEVDFNGASWELIDYENIESEPGGGRGHVELSGNVSNGFTVTIAKGDEIS